MIRSKNGSPRRPGAIEDAGLIRLLRETKASDRGEAGIPFAEVKRQLASARRRNSKR
jgi:hypothetical protein